MLDPRATNLKIRRLQRKLDFWRGVAITGYGMLFCVLCFLVARGWS